MEPDGWYQKEADTTANPEFKGQLPQDIFSASVINLLLAEEEETAVWKKRIKQRKLAHLEDSKQVVNNLQNVNSEKSATAEIDNQLRKWVAEAPFDDLPGYNTIKKKGISTMEFTKYGITETPKLIYNNPLASKSDIDGFVLEGLSLIHI